MPTPFPIAPPTVILDAPEQRVYLIDAWADEWELQPYIWCTHLSLLASPGVSSATIIWRYGEGLQAGTSQFQQYDFLNLDDKYIKIEIDDPVNGGVIRWAGQVKANSDRPDGSRIDSSGSRRQSGVAVYQVLGIEAMLARKRITFSVVANPLGELYTIGRGLTFNEIRGRSGVFGANMTPFDVGATRVFDSDLSRAEPWGTFDIIKYLLFHHAPVDANGENKIIFSLDISGIAGPELGSTPDWQRPRVPSDGRSVKALFDQLLNRRRLLGWTTDLFDVPQAPPRFISIRPFRWNDADITTADGTEILANPKQWAVDFDLSVDADNPQLNFRTSDVFEQVEAVGDYLHCCFTVSYSEGTWSPDWALTTAEGYNAGVSAADDYPPEEDRDKRHRRNRDARRSEEFTRVYSYFSIPPEWDGLVGDGEGGALKPYLQSLISPSDPEPFYPPELTMLSRLPLLTDHDYSEEKIEFDEVIDNTGAGQRPEFLKPMVFLRLQDDVPDEDDPDFEDRTKRFALAEQYGAHAETPPGKKESFQPWSANVRVQDKVPGLVIKTVGAPQHVLASEDFTAPDDSDNDALGALDWAKDMFATVAIRADCRVFAHYPETVISTSDVVHCARIETGDEHQQHYIAPGTVVGLVDGVPQRTTGGFIRDDTEQLKDLARFAYEWHATERQAMIMPFKSIIGGFRVGDIISQIGGAETLQNVRTPITEINYEMPEAVSEDAKEPPGFRTIIRTDFPQLATRIK